MTPNPNPSPELREARNTTSQENVMRKDGSQFTEADHARYVIKDDCPPTVHARLNAVSNRWESPVEVRK